MYVPPAFREEDLPTLHALMREARLANLVTATADGLMATPLPLLLAPEEGPYGTLYGHLARANPQWSLPAAGEAMVLFSGPEAYVSPSWYPSKKEHRKVVPTWNYMAVHAYGPAEFFEDAGRLRDVVVRLTDRHEGVRAQPWAVADAPEPFVRGQLKGIVGLRLPITRLEGKRKMSQNRTEADRAGVAAGLGASDSAAERAVAALIPK
ncbi:FMN-binding negative transcriptional regulator [Pseudoroseomonas globiformis]|uniref:FMN-binding negative transcriptional regulator n=1 Tax=Teichococcus globiformis TaxID=2307229 RepID=A0ABV7FY89_9PROT